MLERCSQRLRSAAIRWETWFGAASLAANSSKTGRVPLLLSARKPTSATPAAAWRCDDLSISDPPAHRLNKAIRLFDALQRCCRRTLFLSLRADHLHSSPSGACFPRAFCKMLRIFIPNLLQAHRAYYQCQKLLPNALARQHPNSASLERLKSRHALSSPLLLLFLLFRLGGHSLRKCARRSGGLRPVRCKLHKASRAFPGACAENDGRQE
jgi:hypothetical protein